KASAKASKNLGAGGSSRISSVSSGPMWASWRATSSARWSPPISSTSPLATASRPVHTRPCATSVDFGACLLAPLGHLVHELPGKGVHELAQGCSHHLLGVTQGRQAERVLATRDALDLDAEAVQRAFHVHGSRDYANGAREGLRLGEDAVGTHG